VGKNGAGKSTLLKLLTRVTLPTNGIIKAKGRISSLLEVGTGFHPELTGRENIYLNGTILGMKRLEIKKKFDDIVDFAGVHKYIDTPVKRYSSGMYTRLAFGVAAHLESEIMIIDEVLAVGDLEFQKKCLGKMNEVSKNEGRTILFVSHNMGSLAELCNTGILLENGKLKSYGKIHDVIEEYYNNNISMNFYTNLPQKENSFSKIYFINQRKEKNIFSFSDKITIVFEGNCIEKNTCLGLTIKSSRGEKIFTTYTQLGAIGDFRKEVIIPERLLLNGEYFVDVAIFIPNGQLYDYVFNALRFRVFDIESELSIFGENNVGVINVKCEWN
jgi:lipopolysaccharide transport system ATP-binding protein